MAEIAGLKLIVPSSVAGSGVSVSASGKVTFTSAATVSMNGVFSATYDNYLAVIRYTNTSDTNTRFRLRASGTDATGSNYTYQLLRAGSTSVTGSRASADDKGGIGGVSISLMSGEHFYLYGPALAQPTATRAVNVSGISDARIDEYATTHSLSTAYDGFTFYAITGNMTGTCTVYGLSQ
jgi:hypothetical protein